MEQSARRDGWSGLELRHLAALEALAAYGSFGRAAAQLGYTQSAISQQIAALERAVGHPLVNRPRGAQPLTLTDAGSRLLEHAAAIHARVAVAAADLAALGVEAPPLRIATIDAASARVVSTALRRIAAAGHAVEATTAHRHAAAVAMLERGEADVAFAEVPLPERAPFRGEIVAVEPFSLLVSHGSPLAEGGDALGSCDLHGAALLTLDTSPSTDFVLNALRAAGARPTVVHRIDDVDVLVELAAAGAGAALVAGESPVPPQLRRLQLADVPPRSLALAWRSDRELPASGRRFVELVRELYRTKRAAVAPRP